MNSTCMLVIPKVMSYCTMLLVTDRALMHAVSIVLNSRNPAKTRLVSPSRHAYFSQLSLLFFGGVWCRSFVKFCPVSFSSGR